MITIRTMNDALIGQDGLIVRDSGVWAKDKLYYLERYLKIFSVGMKNKWLGRLYYVDLFAGPGQCRIKDTGEEFDGSPLIALLNFDFAEYFFIEADKACYEALDARVKKRDPEKYKYTKIVHGDCNEEINKIKIPTTGLGLAFIDPTGIAPLAFDTVRKLTADRRIDLIINFHEGMGIRMNIHQYTQKEGSALDSFMGSDRWRQRFRKAPASIDQVCREIAAEYRENLQTLGYQVFEGDQVPIRTDRNTLLYYLLFASKHPKGSEFWRKIGEIDARGQRKFKIEGF